MPIHMVAIIPECMLSVLVGTSSMLCVCSVCTTDLPVLLINTSRLFCESKKGHCFITQRGTGKSRWVLRVPRNPPFQVAVVCVMNMQEYRSCETFSTTSGTPLCGS